MTSFELDAEYLLHYQIFYLETFKIFKEIKIFVIVKIHDLSRFEFVRISKSRNQWKLKTFKSFELQICMQKALKAFTVAKLELSEFF